MSFKRHFLIRFYGQSGLDLNPGSTTSIRKLDKSHNFSKYKFSYFLEKVLINFIFYIELAVKSRKYMLVNSYV